MKIFNNKSYWISSGVFSLLHRFSNAGFGFITFVIIIRILSKDQFGIWVLFLTVTSLNEVIRLAFIRNPLIKYLNSEDNSLYKDIVTSSLILNIVLASAVSVIIWFGAYLLADLWEAPELVEMFHLYIVIYLIQIISTHSTCLSQANLDFKNQFYSLTVNKLTYTIILLYFFIYDISLKLSDLIFIQYFGVIAGAGVALFLSRKFQVVSFRFNKKWIINQFNFGKYSFGTSISSLVLKNTDSWMLSKIINTTAVAIYNPAIRISNLFEIPIIALANTSFPKMAQRIREEGNSAAKYLYEKSVGTLLAVTIPAVAFVLIFAEEIVYIIAGDDYTSSANIVRVTMLYGLIIPFNRQFGTTMDALGRARLNFKILFITTFLNIVFNIVFIKYFGIIGAAYATFSSYTIVLIINEIILKSMINVKIINIINHFFKSYLLVFQKIKNIYKLNR